MTKSQNDPYTPKPGKRHNLFIIAYKNFPRGVLETMTGVAFLTAHILYNYIWDLGVHSVVLAVIITGVIIALLPLSALYIFTLLRSSRIRRRIETEAQHQLEILSDDLEILKAREQKEEKEVLRLEEVVKTDMKARRKKDEKEDERWDLLNESLRLQNKTVELASEERLLVAQQVKEIKDEGEVIRKGLVSDDLEARHVKDLKEDKRWDQLNERLRVQEETGQLNIDQKEEREIARQELASEERLLVAQKVKDVRDGAEVVRQELASDGLKAQKIKDQKEDERWDLLNERLRVQKETGELASEERLIVAQHVKDLKEEGEDTRRELVSDDLKARLIKNQDDEKHWEELHERLRIQEERSEERDRQQALRDREHIRLRYEDDLKDQYKSLFARYLRNSSGTKLEQDVANGLVAIPESWLAQQPEIVKNPLLLQLLKQYNTR